MQLFSTTAGLLRAKQTLFANVLHRHIRWLAACELVLIGVIGAALYGAAVSLDTVSWQSLWTFAWQAATLLWLSVAVCFPSLAVFTAVRGSTASLRELFLFTLASVATIGLVLLSVAPIIAFFHWTGGLPQNVNLIVFIGSIFLGIIYLGQALIFAHEERKESTHSSAPAVDILVVWGILLMIVLFRMMEWLRWM